MSASTAVIFDIIGRDKASNAFDKVGNSADKSSSKMSNFGAKAKDAGKKAAIGFGLAATATVGAGVYVFNYGAKLQQMGMKAETVFGNQLATVDKWADKNAHAMGLTTREATGLAAGFADLLIPMGFSRKEAAKMSTEVVGLSGALSQWSGGTKSAAEVTEILNAAMLGETDGLKALGISIGAADVEAQLLKKGQDKLTGSARQQAEAQAIQTLIMEKSVDAQAAFAKGGSPLLSTQAKLKATFGEVRDELVTGLIPAVTLMADWFMAKALPAVKQFAKGLILAWDVIKSGEDVAAGLGETLDFALGNTGKYVGPITKIASTVRSVFGSLKGDIGGSMTGIKEIFTNALSIIQSLWSAFGGNITQYLKATFTNLKMIVQGAFTVIRGIFKTVSALLKGDWSGAWDGIKMIFRGAAQVVIGMVRQLGNLVRFAFKNLGVAAKAIFGGMWSGIKTMAGNAVDWLVDKIRAIPGKLLGLHKAFARAGKSLIVSLASGIKNAAGFASDFAGEIWAAVKRAINGGIDKLNGLLEFDMKVKGVGIHVNAPDIGHLARGTDNWRGGWTVVGEEGPELANLPGGTKVVPHAKSVGMMRGMGGGGGNVVININGALDPVAVGRQVEQVLIKYTRATNRPLQVSTL